MNENNIKSPLGGLASPFAMVTVDFKIFIILLLIFYDSKQISNECATKKNMKTKIPCCSS